MIGIAALPFITLATYLSELMAPVPPDAATPGAAATSDADGKGVDE